MPTPGGEAPGYTERLACCARARPPAAWLHGAWLGWRVPSSRWSRFHVWSGSMSSWQRAHLVSPRATMGAHLARTAWWSPAYLPPLRLRALRPHSQRARHGSHREPVAMRAPQSRHGRVGMRATLRAMPMVTGGLHHGGRWGPTRADHPTRGRIGHSGDGQHLEAPEDAGECLVVGEGFTVGDEVGGEVDGGARAVGWRHGVAGSCVLGG